MFQISEVMLYDNYGSNIALLSATNPGGSYPHTAALAIDGNTRTKMEDQNIRTQTYGHSYVTAANGYTELTLTLARSSVVASYDIFTANDAIEQNVENYDIFDIF